MRVRTRELEDGLTAQPSWAKRHLTGTLLLTVATVAGAVFGGLQLWGGSFFSWRGTEPPDNIAASPEGGQSAAPPSAADALPTESGCLDASLASVDCQAQHRYELVAASVDACGPEAAVEHLGGDPQLDVVIPQAQPITIPGRDDQVCAVAVPDTVLSAPLEDILRTPDAAAWRQCVDTRYGSELVACNAAHTGEYVGTGGLEAGDDCTPRAEDYMNANLQRVGGRVTVETVRLDLGGTASSQCVIRVLGTEVLVDSLRNIGPRMLPLQQPD
jgi:hypothetical protein